MIGGNNVAWIKSNRYNEFVIGESKNLLFPTSFRKSFSRKSKEENIGNKKYRVGSPLEYIM